MGVIILPYDDAREIGADLDIDEDAEALTPERLRSMLSGVVAGNQGLARTTASQRLLDQLCAACLHEGELELGNAVAILHALRVAGQQGTAIGVLMELVNVIGQQTLESRACRVCGCTESRACPGGCSWVEFDLCSACAGGRPGPT